MYTSILIFSLGHNGHLNIHIFQYLQQQQQQQYYTSNAYYNYDNQIQPTQYSIASFLSPLSTTATTTTNNSTMIGDAELVVKKRNR
jgi:hypothetical protein